MWPSLPLPNQPSAFSVIKHSRDLLVARTQCGIPLLGGFWSKKNSLIWILIARQCVSAHYLECTAPSYNKLGFRYPLPEHNLEAFRQNYKPMKRPISVPEQSQLAPLCLYLRACAFGKWGGGGGLRKCTHRGQKSTSNHHKDSGRLLTNPLKVHFPEVISPRIYIRSFQTLLCV